MIRTFTILLAASATAALAQTQCEALKSLNIPQTQITSAKLVAAGPYQVAGRGGAGKQAAKQDAKQDAKQNAKQAPAAAAPQMLPAHCRVAMVLMPTSDSHIEMEVWLPAGGAWNGKFEAVGGGGWAGTISFAAMVTAMQEGYATASTDTGHMGGNADFALGHPEKIVDFGYRAIHEMTLKSKDLIKAFYGSPARLSYFNGCSTGGRQALMEAQRFPEDFDGIVAGAPANNHIHLHVAGTARAIDIINIPGEHALTRAKQDFLAKAVMAACDKLDGVQDGLLTNPRQCKYDPQELLCKGIDSDTCLTAPQIAAVKRTYADTITKKGEIVWTGFERGAEAGLGVIGTAKAPTGGLASIQILGYQDANWDWHQFDLDRDLKVTVDRAPSINADNPDLSKFKAHGGKLLLYHGWSDPSIPPGNTINYYNNVLNKMGKNQDDWMRLFMIPGMNHCGGGAGPNQFSYIATMERWRESSKAPDALLGFHVANNRVDMSRPVCKYPQVATYTGTGSTNDAANFTCK